MKKTIFFSLFIIFCTNLFPVQKGSNTAVSVEPAFTFPNTDSNNNMLTFGWFKNGFTLQDSSTTCSFESIFPVGGVVSLNGGSLYLASDLHFAHDSSLSSFGRIIGNLYNVEFDESFTAFADTNNPGWLEDVVLITNADLNLTATLRFQGDCSFNGRGRRINLSTGSSIVVGDSSTLRIKDATFVGVSGYNIKCINDSGKIILDNVLIIQDANYNFTVGSLQALNTVDISGTYTFFYESTNSFTINRSSEFNITEGMTFYCGDDNVVNSNRPFWMVDSTSKLSFENAFLNVGPAGLQLTRGGLDIKGRLDVDMHSTDTSNGLIGGDGTDDGNLFIRCYPASYLNFKNGHVTYNMTEPDRIKSMSSFSRLIRGASNVFYIPKDILFADVSIKMDPASVLQVESGKEVAYKNCNIKMPGIKFNVTGSRFNTYTTLLDGNEEIFLQEGILPLYFLIKNSGNLIRGNGSISGGITLYDSSAELSLNLDGQILNDITLNEGKVSLAHDLEFGHARLFLGQGTVDLSDKDFMLGTDDLTWTGSVYWDGSGGVLGINSDLTLSGRWTFSGNCTINADNNILDFRTGGEILVEKGSTLKLRNIKMTGLSEGKIRCLDNHGKVLLDNVLWIQDGNYSFTVGSLQILNQVDLTGSGTFFYDSSNSMTINSNSELNIFNGTTCYLGNEQGTNSNKLIWFTDPTSKLSLDNAPFKIGPAGLHFTRGGFEVRGRVDVDIYSTSTSNGLIAGDGTADGDMFIRCYPASYLNFKNGHVTYNMTEPDRIKSMSSFAKLIRGAGNVFHIQKNILFSDVSIKVDPTSVLSVESGKEVGYSNCKVGMPGVKFGITGSRFNTYTTLLDGNEEIFLQEGILPLYFLIKNSGNVIRGNGGISGVITLYDSSAELSLNLDGQILNDITLNGGTVSLAHDLEFGHARLLLGQGTVDLSDKDFMLGTDDLTWTGSVYWDGSGGVLGINSDLTLSGRWTFSGNCTINADNNILDFTTGAEILVEKGSTLKLRNIKITGLSDGKIRCLDENGKLLLDNVLWIQDGSYTFSIGSMQILNQVDLTGSGTFFYDSSNSLTIGSNSELNIFNGTTCYLGNEQGTNSNKLIWFTDSTSKLSLDNAPLKIGPAGILLTRGDLEIRGRVDVDINSTDTSNGLIGGDGTEQGDMYIRCHPASYLNFKNGHVTYNMTKTDRIKSMSSFSKLIRGAGNVFYIQKDILFSDVSLKLDPASILLVDTGKEVGYRNCKVAMPGVKFGVTGSRYNTYTTLLDGNEEVFLQEGTFPLYILIKNTGNLIRGNGSISGGITIFDSNAELSLNLDGQILNNISLNGGKVTLDHDLVLSHNSFFTNNGTVDINTYGLTLGTDDLTWTSTIYWDGNFGLIEQNSNIDFYSTWTFSGDCTWDGGNNIFQIKEGSQIIVERGSTLRLKNMRLHGLEKRQIRCLDDSGQIIFDGVTCELHDDYRFEKGSIKVEYYFTLEGSHTFSYQSSQASMVAHGATLTFLPDVRFSYNPPVADGSLFYLESYESKMVLDGATLHSTSTGLHLTKGTLQIKGDCQVESGASYRSEGIVFGEGTSEASDLTLEICPESNLKLTSGYLIYKNVN